MRGRDLIETRGGLAARRGTARRGAVRCGAVRSEAARRGAERSGAHCLARAQLHDSECSVKKSIDLPSDVSN